MKLRKFVIFVISLFMFSSAFAVDFTIMGQAMARSWNSIGIAPSSTVVGKLYSYSPDMGLEIQGACQNAAEAKQIDSQQWQYQLTGIYSGSYVTVPQHVRYEYDTLAGDLSSYNLHVNGNRYVWSWWFGDGTTIIRTGDDQRDIPHTYSRTGVYQLAYVTTGTDKVLMIGGSVSSNGSLSPSLPKYLGSSDLMPTSCGWLHVKVVPDQTPITYGYANNYYPDTTTAVTFYAGSSYNPVNKRVKLSYTWQFDDGVVLHGATVRHTFTTGGKVGYRNHTVTLTASDGYLAGKSTITVHVKDADVIGCSSSDSTICK